MLPKWFQKKEFEKAADGGVCTKNAALAKTLLMKNLPPGSGSGVFVLLKQTDIQNKRYFVELFIIYFFVSNKRQHL